MSWLPSALAVAAMLLVVVVGMQTIGGGGDDAEEAGGGDTGSAAEGGTLSDGPGPATLTLSKSGMRMTFTTQSNVREDEAATSYEGAASEGSESESADSDPQPSAPQDALEPRANGTGGQEASLLSDRAVEDRLKRFASTNRVFTRLAKAYTVDDVATLGPGFIAQLAEEAPEDASVQVTECAELVVTSRQYATLTAAAAHGKFRGDESLLLGFVWTPEDRGPLDNYVLYVWPRGDCESPTHSQSGRIRTGNR